MFSDYASKFLSKSQRPVPLFEGASAGFDSDTENFLGRVGESLASSTTTDIEDDPPDDIAIERANELDNGLGSVSLAASEHTAGPNNKTRYPNWADSVRSWRGGPPADLHVQSLAQHAHGMQSSAGPPLYAHSEVDENEDPPSLVTGQSPFGDASYASRGIEHAVAGAYLIATATSLATAVLVYLTTTPSPVGVYPIFSRSAGHLIAYGALAAMVSAGWLMLMRTRARAMIQINTMGVPFLLAVIALYGLVVSFHSANGHGTAHAAMRTTSLGVLALAGLWAYILRRGRNLVGRATEMIVLAVDVANGTPGVFAVAAVTGAAALALAGLWVVFLARGFLEGRLSPVFAAWFTFLYLWTWGVLAAIQKCTVVGVTANWYYRFPVPNINEVTAGPAVPPAGPPPRMLETSLYNAFTIHFGASVVSALVEIVARVPLLILPRRVGATVQKALALAASVSAMRLLDPLTLPAAVVLRSPLSAGAAAVTSPGFAAANRRAYRLAKIMLLAARGTCALLVAVVAWTAADRANTSASVYGYMVGFVALCVGWTVVGAAEDTLSTVMDGLYVSFSLDGVPKRSLEAERVFASDEDLV